jgi:hypothetical protein
MEVLHFTYFLYLDEEIIFVEPHIESNLITSVLQKHLSIPNLILWFLNHSINNQKILLKLQKKKNQ